MNNPHRAVLRLCLISPMPALDDVLREYASGVGQIEITDATDADFLCASHIADLDKNNDRTKPILFLVPHGGVAPSVAPSDEQQKQFHIVKIFHLPLRLMSFIDDAMIQKRLLAKTKIRDCGAGLFFNPITRSLYQDDEHGVILSDKEADFFVALMEAGDQGLRLEDAMRDIWGYHDEADSHAAETTLYRLRQKTENLLKANKASIINEQGFYKWVVGTQV